MRAPAFIRRMFHGESGKVFRGMAMLATGAGAGRVIGLAMMPILTRIYSPEDYGALSIYAAIVAVIAPFLTLRYALAIPLPRRDATAAGLIVLSFLTMAITSLVLILGLWLGGERILGALNLQTLLPCWPLIVVGAVSAATYELLSMWATRRRAYGVIASTTAWQSLIGESSKLLLGLAGLRPEGLLLGHALTQGGGVAALSIQLARQIRRHAKQIRWKLVALLGGRYSDYPVFRLPSQFLLVLAMQAPLFLTARYFDAATTGQLGLALMAVGLPVTLLGDSMGRAYYAEISSIGKRQPEKLRRITREVVKKLFIISILPTVVLATSGDWIFSKAFGGQWATAGGFASILSVYLIFQFIQKPVSFLLFLYDGQKLLLYLNIQRIALIGGCFYFGHLAGLSIERILVIFSLVIAIHYLISIILAVRFIRATPPPV